MSRKHVPLAIAYDFDGTLAPGNMQEHQFLPEIGIEENEFWKNGPKAETQKDQADNVLVYMNLMLKKAHANDVPVHREAFIKSREIFSSLRVYLSGLIGSISTEKVEVCTLSITCSLPAMPKSSKEPQYSEIQEGLRF